MPAFAIQQPGRLEIISATEPFILLDGAHNPQGSMALAETWIRFWPGESNLPVGVLKDKDYREILSEILINREYRPAHIMRPNRLIRESAGGSIGGGNQSAYEV